MDKQKIQSSIILCMISAVAGAGLTFLSTSSNEEWGKGDNSFQKIAECRKIIDQKAAGIFNEKDAINGYLSSGLDQYTYIIKDKSSDKTAQITSYVNNSGTAIASGFQVACSDDGCILLIDVEEEKAAYKSGLRKNDVVVKIAGNDVAREGYANIANKLLGKQDTEVELQVRRESSVITLIFKRDNIFIRSIDWERMNDVGYIQIKDYNDMSVFQMSEALQELSGCKKYIVDLRRNGGGQIDIAISLLQYFSPGIKIELVGEKVGNEEKVVQKGNTVIEGPVVLLVDSETGSSSEIVTSAIKQYNSKATILGQNTFGKGIYQNHEILKSGDYLSYTAGYFTVGDWECWQGKGIEPDIEVLMDPSLIGTDDDIQLKKALELLG